MPTTTTNYNLYRPLVNDPTDQDLWGGYLNTNMDTIDAAMYALKGSPTLSKTANYTTVASDSGKTILCNATGGSFTISLLAAATAGDGYRLTIKKTDSSANTVTIDPNGAETIDGAATFVLSNQYDAVGIVCNGTAFSIVYRSQKTHGRAVQIFTASGTYTPTTGMVTCRARLVGSGGGGGGVSGGGMGGGGGGAGGYAEDTFTAAQIGASKTVTINSAGTGGASSGANGTAGGTASLGSLLVAAGGSGGQGGTSSALYYNGGASGNGTTGTIKTYGQQGESGVAGGGAFAGRGGNGGMSLLGGGGLGGASGAGAAAPGYGGGGGGGGGGAYAGGNGKDGIVIIEETLLT